MRPADPDTANPPTEQELVEENRYWEARRVGLDHKEARIFACNGSDVGVLRKLARDGCPLKLLSRIVI